MLRKHLIPLVLTLIIMSPVSNAKEIEGVNMPESLEVTKSKLILNGAGARSKFFMDLYIGGLYLQNKSNNPKEIIEGDELMAIRLHIISSLITSKKMEDATREGFENATKGNTEPIKSQIEEFISVFKEKIEENDIFDLIYLPGKGLEVYKNSEFKSRIEGLVFKQALFGIWLSDKPAQKSLREDMLGN
ncbi:MAG: chalcone isomerase family protein [Deltaproteobacteria bacterium]|nr:MAG: chalcone isomerase family protein [Deltaproteobacteria bacterium]